MQYREINPVSVCHRAILGERCFLFTASALACNVRNAYNAPQRRASPQQRLCHDRRGTSCGCPQCIQCMPMGTWPALPALPRIAHIAAMPRSLPCIVPQRPLWRSWLSLLNNGWQWEHGLHCPHCHPLPTLPASPRCPAHCQALPTLPALPRCLAHCHALPRNAHHGDHGYRCSTMDGNAGTHEGCPYDRGCAMGGMVGHCPHCRDARIAAHCPHCRDAPPIARHCPATPNMAIMAIVAHRCMGKGTSVECENVPTCQRKDVSHLDLHGLGRAGGGVDICELGQRKLLGTQGVHLPPHAQP